MAAKTYYERRAFRDALKNYLDARGWSAVTYREGFKPEGTIIVPTVAIHFLPSRKTPLEMAPNSNTYQRYIQVDAYMESEDRAGAISEEVMDFMDLVPMIIEDESSTKLGSLICFDTDSITSETMAPILNNPKVIHWRGVTRGTFEAHYIKPITVSSVALAQAMIS